jgi:hypothetical protein
VPVVLASTLLYPQALDPSWTHGTPADQLPWLISYICVTAIVAVCTFIARVTVNDDTVRIVNPWGTHEMSRASVVDVRPGPFGVEFVGASGDRHVALAVRCTAGYVGERPRWVELAHAVTGEEPRWRDGEEAEEED